MKKTIFTSFLLLLSLFGWSQVTTNPTFITQTGGSFDIIFDASAGSAGLKGLTTGVYAHIGVITSASLTDSDWKYVLTPWPASATDAKANTTKNALTYVSANKWKLTITPNIQDFLAVPSTETITKIALVFRNAAGTVVGKTSSEGDIFVNVLAGGLTLAFTNPLSDKTVSFGTQMNIQFSSSEAANLNLYINDVNVKSLSNATTLTHSYTFATVGDYTLIAEGTLDSKTVRDTVVISATTARPVGVKTGINYISSTSATLVLHAPGKTSVYVIGEFNNWTQNETYKMYKDGDYWWLTLTGLTPGQMYAYQYLVDGSIKISDPYTELVLDPWNDGYISSTIFPNRKPYPSGKTNGLVATLQTAKTAYNWQITNFAMPTRENMVIYEMLLRDFTTEQSLLAAINKLDYLKKLGIKAVELMPITEFDGNNSWGYNVNHYFAPDKAYGTPDMYKQFIDECHKRNIAVILDMVFNHASGINPFAMLYWDGVNNRPAANNPFMNPVAPHPYSVENDFNHSFSGTREYFKRVLQYWITEYKVDGYRMDLSKGLTQTSSNESTAPAYDQSRVDIITEYYNAVKDVKSDAMFILEHFCDYAEESALANSGIFMWRNVNNAYSEAAMGYSPSSDFSAMNSFPRKWVGFAESHDEERNFYKVKMWGAGTLSTDSLARIARVPLNIAFTTLIPGPKMIWQFGEMGYDYSIDSNGGRTNPKTSAWSYLNLAHRKAAYDACCKILNLRKMDRIAFTTGIFSMQIAESDWSQGRRIALTSSDLNMIVLGNFNATSTVTANPTFQHTGTWYNYLTGEVFNVTNTAMTISMQPGQLLIFINKKPISTELDEVSTQIDCSVFPTITTGKVYVSTTATVKSVRVYSMQGSLIKTVSNTTEIDMSDTTNGLYLMEVTTTEGKSVYKIIKD